MLQPENFSCHAIVTDIRISDVFVIERRDQAELPETSSLIFPNLIMPS